MRRSTPTRRTTQMDMHYWKRVLYRGLKSLPRASARSPRQRHPRQIWPVGSRRPKSVRLCRGPAVRPSAKFFYSVFGPKKYFFINSLCRGLEVRPSAKGPLPRAPGLALGKDPLCRRIIFYFFCFLSPIFFDATIHSFEPKIKIWSNFDFYNMFS